MRPATASSRLLSNGPWLAANGESRFVNREVQPQAILNLPMVMATDLSQMEREALDALSKASAEDDIEQWRVDWLGRQDGRLTALLRSIREQPPESRAEFGA